MELSYTNADEFGRGKRGRLGSADDAKMGSSAMDTARKNLIKELRKQGIQDQDAELYGKMFMNDDRLRQLWMPVLAVVIKNIANNREEGLRGNDYVTGDRVPHLESMLGTLLEGRKHSPGYDKTKERYDLYATAVRYNSFATKILERNE